MKKIPRFKSESEERAFWATHDATEFVDFSRAKRVSFPELHPSAKTISIRLPESLLSAIKEMANRMDVPYQSLMKVLLADAVKRAGKQPRARALRTRKTERPTARARATSRR